MMHKLGLLAAYLIFTSTAFAQNTFLISEPSSVKNLGFTTPLDLTPSADKIKSTVIQLLKWNIHADDPPAPSTPYDRKFFGNWIKQDKVNYKCLDTRDLVLVRDSASPVQHRDERNCKVAAGEWLDPYTDNRYTKVDEVQVDHLVPLRDAYINGAWKWNFKAKCSYYNYVGYRDHLKVVDGIQNKTKGARSPELYMPPNAKYRCQYLKEWLAVKLIWRLGMQRSEASAIQKLVQDEKCNPEDFVFSTEELKELRAKIENTALSCPANSPLISED